MSYDVSLLFDTGRGELCELVDVGNYTSNVGSMYRAAMPGPYPGGGKYDGIKDLDGPCGGLPGISGLSCKEAARVLSSGLAYMREHSEDMRALNPSNGWGEFAGAVAFLERILDACNDHPRGVVAVNW